MPFKWSQSYRQFLLIIKQFNQRDLNKKSYIKRTLDQGWVIHQQPKRKTNLK